MQAGVGVGATGTAKLRPNRRCATDLNAGEKLLRAPPASQMQEQHELLLGGAPPRRHEQLVRAVRPRTATAAGRRQQRRDPILLPCSGGEPLGRWRAARAAADARTAGRPQVAAARAARGHCTQRRWSRAEQRHAEREARLLGRMAPAHRQENSDSEKEEETVPRCCCWRRSRTGAKVRARRARVARAARAASPCTLRRATTATAATAATAQADRAARAAATGLNTIDLRRARGAPAL